jgi:hypothetical protein
MNLQPRLLLPSFLAGLLLLTSCDDEVVDPPDDDTVADDDDDDTTADPGADPSVPAQPGEARAGVVRGGADGEAALFGGLTAEGRAGDVKIYNHLVQFVIQGPYTSHGYMDAGGNVIDLDLVRPEGMLGRDTAEDVFLAFDLARLFHAETVEVVADGLDGGPAIVRATGSDIAWAWFQGMLEFEEPTVGDLGLAVVVDYELPPDSYSLRMTATLTNTGDEAIETSPQGGIFASGEDMVPWAPGTGLEGPQGDDLPCVAFTGKQGEAAFSLWPGEGAFEAGAITELAAELGIALAGHGRTEIGAGESLSLVSYLTVATDAATAEAERRGAHGEPLGTVTGVVEDSVSGDGIAGARVHFVEDGLAGQVGGFAVTDESGAFEARLPPGSWTAYAVARSDDEVVQMTAGAGRYGPYTAATVNEAQLAVLRGEVEGVALPFAVGRTESAPVTLDLEADGEATADLMLEPSGELRVEILDTLGEPLPAVVEVRWDTLPGSSVPAELKDALGVPTSSRAAWAWTADGVVHVPVIPGTVSVGAGHSWRYDQQTVEAVEVLGGDSVPVQITLTEVVPREGWLAVDAHLHGAPSFDGALPMEHRLITCAATGVDIPVTTDHDAMVEYRDLAEALRLQTRMHVVPGVEVTTLIRGHFNTFPIEPQPLTETNGGAEAWWIDPGTTSELFERMRTAAGPDALMQVNHPRSPGMFLMAGFDPETGEPADEDYWSWDFELFELLNGGVDDVADIREDWFGLLDHGEIRTPTGVSDSHYRFIPCGLGRTDVYLGTDSPAEVDDDALTEALRAGHVVVAAGTTLRASMTDGSDTYLPGDTLVGTTADLNAAVLAPAWIQPGTLRVYRNGEIIHEQALDAPDPDGVWFDGGWTVDSEVDAWFVVEVEGAEPMGDIWRNAPPYAAANAFFLDVDGDGWSAPLR